MRFSANIAIIVNIIFLFIVVEFVLPTFIRSGDVRFRRYYRNNGRVSRAATAKKERIWPEGIIPFVIASNFSGEHQHLFLRAMRHWENFTCVSFVPRQPHHKHYITFTVDKCGCCSYVGRRGEGPQAISIGKNCDKFGIVVHELGHVVGFWHEHTRPDRDMYVDIFYKSIQTGQDYNFEKSKPEEVDSLGEPYDFSSIMHYARDTFSRGAFYDTILPKPNSGFRLEIGQRVQLSEGDIRQTKKLYKCAECGGTLMQESGNLAIQHAGVCTWHIISPQGHTIFLNITGSTLSPPSSLCGKEEDNVITVRDGVSISSPVLDRICGGDSLFRTIASSGNRMLIQVRSSTPAASLPFATYYAICGGPIYANEGVIHSPKYPESYPPNSDCQWTIHVDENSQVAIEFVYFHLEQHKECIYDRLILTEGISKNSKKDGKEMSETFCGLIEKKTIVSKTNQISLRFFSDNSVQKTGFELRFTKELNECATDKNICHHYCVNTVGGFKCACRVGYSLSSNGFSCDSTCGGYLKASNGSISSPNFPEMYPNSKTCIWEIEAPDGYHIFLNFTKFNVEGMKTECAYDYVKIGDSEKLCGEYHEALLFTTPRNRVRIEFSSDSSVERDGFFANFIADFDECQNDNAGCEHTCQNRLGSYVCTCNPGYILAEDKHNCKEGSCFFEVNAPAGDINSPNYPNDYPKGQNCSWHFVTTPGHRLMLTFSSFQVEEHAQCKYDAVSVYDGGDGSAQLAGVFCGLAPPPLLLSSSNELYLTFSSDASVSRRGFQAHYTSLCGGRLTAESTPGHIYSHATFSDSKYGKNQDCSWIVRAKSPGRGVRIQFSTFNIESEEGCQYDYIEIYDGPEATLERLVGRFCGDTSPEVITSTGPELLLIMHTDNAEEEKGFVAEYREAPRSSSTKRTFVSKTRHSPLEEPIHDRNE
ncbi:Zinc metalloproteinase nas-39 [Caenorhabditis elegans]|uniref:Zinc metalloproteinase nas-39 n=1 Tax=Caenorhabditis elegans TaxID=6239 RepID=NAS39_CAEEL|nr:Zinc metalloproteinase nas-39 [Caenorhabditis elegans]Q20176.4 RecName: Full=Zinc metalloproteinase nas-39; AltName: Full=Nematode astacin 39; Flags: Precursor [Caenorhabditis elegans]CCD70820.2 Zinc metalloproteinase nas-39 [Caenorhabditis elegans]